MEMFKYDISRGITSTKMSLISLKGTAKIENIQTLIKSLVLSDVNGTH